MHTLDLTDFEALVAVAEELHFGRAAIRLHMSQPPLSRRIQRMEEDLGVALFERDNRNVRLTRAGEALLPEARAVLLAARQAVELAQKVACGQGGVFRLGFISPALDTRLPACIREFSSRFPGVRLLLEEGATTDLLDRLRADRLDLAVCRLFEPPEGLESSLFLREDYVLALPEQHPMAGRSTPLTPEDFGGFPLIHFPRVRHSSLHDAVLAALSTTSGGPMVVQEAVTKRTALALVEAGLGGALVTRSMAGVEGRDAHGVVEQVVPQEDGGVGDGACAREAEQSKKAVQWSEAVRPWRGMRFVELDCPALPPVELHLVRAASGAGPAGEAFAQLALSSDW